jgi:putative transposase
MRALAMRQLADGVSAPRISSVLPLTAQAIRNIGRRYQSGGLDAALYDKQRPGAAAILHDSQKTAAHRYGMQRSARGVRSLDRASGGRGSGQAQVGSASRKGTIRILLLHHDLKPWREKHVVRGRSQ